MNEILWGTTINSTKLWSGALNKSYLTTQSETILYASDDSFASEGFHGNTNYWTSTRATVDKSPLIANWYIKFNISAWLEAVTSAIMNLYCTADWFTNTVSVYIVTSDWEEWVITFNNKPTVWASIWAISFQSTLQQRTLDITSTYNDWKDWTIPNYWLMLHGNWVFWNEVYFNTKESWDVTKPYIELTP